MKKHKEVWIKAFQNIEIGIVKNIKYQILNNSSDEVVSEVFDSTRLTIFDDINIGVTKKEIIWNPSYKKGAKFHHDKFGEGTIVSSTKNWN